MLLPELFFSQNPFLNESTEQLIYPIEEKNHLLIAPSTEYNVTVGATLFSTRNLG
jgi:hypothetical protein